VALGSLGAGASQGNALEEVAVVADLRRLADDHPHAMVDEEALADLSAGVDLDAGADATALGNEPGRHTQAPLMKRMSQAMELAGVKAGVGQYNL
jgi:hypothetical protein